MERQSSSEREAAKTDEQEFVRVLEQEFQLAPRMAQAVLAEALVHLRPVTAPTGGQIVVLLAERRAGVSRPLSATPKQRVHWTVDAGASDRAVLRLHGSSGLRQMRLQRLVSEALEQGAVASQEDLANALGVDVRTIKRDFKALQGRGILLTSRGYLHQVGRGQTHKSQIVSRWLAGESYDQLALSTHHSLSSIQRYIQLFVRVVALHEQEQQSTRQIAFLLQCSVRLVEEHLLVYQQASEPAQRQRLNEQLHRLQASETKKGGL
jgi:DNA-binding transcriptional regulator YhcF (GntR family)